ncbi:MAG: glutamate-cysteine ligase family protein [Halanaerobium sp.]|nr:glutamate-cysteine ligase family protein [Halanaerobium sp.]
MEYDKQKRAIADYIERGEKDKSNCRLGLEIEHLVLAEDTMAAVSYYEEKGIGDLLRVLVGQGWQPFYEKDNLLQVMTGAGKVTLEPGGQLELSLQPLKSLQVINEQYLSFLEEVIPVLTDWGRALVAVGYQPVTPIEEVALLPKKRYDYMYSYFLDRGRYAHNMMMGTASLQVNLDYCSEKDFRQKNLVANFLGPLVYIIFDNSPFIAGEPCRDLGLRSLIWDNCDRDRCGFPPGIFQEGFGYEEYAEYILNTPPIIIKKGEELIYTGGQPLCRVFEPEEFNDEELAHIMTMVFPDVRAKDHLEVRSGDTLPYPYSLAYTAFWKGLFYHQDNLDQLYEVAKGHTRAEIDGLKKAIRKKGLGAEIEGRDLLSWFAHLLELAEAGLGQEERRFLQPLHGFLSRQMNPRQITLANYRGDIKEALEWCIIREGKGVEACGS